MLNPFHKIKFTYFIKHKKYFYDAKKITITKKVLIKKIFKLKNILKNGKIS